MNPAKYNCRRMNYSAHDGHYESCPIQLSLAEDKGSEIGESGEKIDEGYDTDDKGVVHDYLFRP